MITRGLSKGSMITRGFTGGYIPPIVVREIKRLTSRIRRIIGIISHV